MRKQITLILLATVSTPLATLSSQEVNSVPRSQSNLRTDSRSVPANTTGSWTRRKALSHHNQVVLNAALVNDEKTIQVLILAEPGQTNAVAQHVARIRGKIIRRVDEMAYLRAVLPIRQAESLLNVPQVVEFQFERSEGVIRGSYDLDLDIAWREPAQKIRPKPSPVRDQSKTSPTPIPPAEETKPTPLPELPITELALENPYIPMRDIGAPQFIAEHPTFDGRGVTVAVIDEGTIDFLHPAYQTARKLDGSLTHKVIGVIDALEPDDVLQPIGSPDPRVRMSRQLKSRQRRLIFENRVYRVPQDGIYRMGVYQAGNSYSKNKKNESYPVLWNEQAGLLWLDTNNNWSFVDESPVRDINEEFSFGTFDNQRSFGSSRTFVALMDRQNHLVKIIDEGSGHATMCSSLAVGNGFLNSPSGGVAPGAQLIPVHDKSGADLHNLVENLIHAAAHPQVDIVTTSAYWSTFPNIGESFINLFLDRLDSVYGKLIVMAAGNSTGPLERVQAAAGSGRVLAIGGYFTRTTVEALAPRGIRAPDTESVAVVSARGPSGDGALKPDVITPLNSISAAPCSLHEFNGIERLAKYQLPRCYRVSTGTSAAAPVAAGAAALLVSAAKQSGIKYDSARLRWALRSGARYLPQNRAHEQGGGLLQVGRAWELLRSQTDLPEIATRAPVRTPLTMSDYARRRGVGVGLYETEMWTAGMAAQRQIEFFRKTGPAQTIRYRLNWRGNNGTFSSSNTLDLPLRERVSLVVDVRPKESGVHSAILELIDPTSGVSVHQVLATILVTDPLTSANDYHDQATVTSSTSKTYSVEVPAGVEALRLNVTEQQGRVAAIIERPGGEARQAAFLSHLRPRLQPSSKGGWSYLIPRPEPGIWQIRVTGVPTPDAASQDQTTASSYGLTVKMLGSNSSLAKSSEDEETEVSYRNLLAPVLGSVTRGEMGSAKRITATLKTGSGPAIHNIEVEPGAKTLYVEANTTRHQNGDLELYLYNCTIGYCHLWELAMPAAASHSLTVRNPFPGLWKAVVSAGPLPATERTFDYIDVVTHPRYGAVTTAPNPVARETAEEWTERTGLRRGSVPPNGREAVALIELTDQIAEEEEMANWRADARAEKEEIHIRPISLATQIVFLDGRKQPN